MAPAFRCYLATAVCYRAVAAHVAYGVELSSVPPATVDVVPQAPGGWMTAGAPREPAAWAGAAPGDAPAALDSDGWPMVDAYVVLVYAPPSAVDPLHFTPPSYWGVWRLTWQGNATLVLGPGANATIVERSFDESTFTSTAAVALGPPLPVLVFGFFGTQRNASAGPNTGLSRLRVRQPGAADATTLFAPALVAALQPFAHVRTMQWTSAWYVQPYGAAPDHGVIGWGSRALPSDALWLTPSPNRAGAFGAPWESVVTLSQELAGGRGVWVNVPVQVDGLGEGGAGASTYLQGLAALLRDGNAATGGDGVPPGAPIYVEYGNEVWLNGSAAAGGGPSGCYAWNRDAAAAEVARGGSDLAADGETDPEVWAYRRLVRSLARIAVALRGAGTVRPVLGWHAPFAAEGERALAWFNATHGAPASFFFGLAINAYVVVPVTAGEGEADMGAAWVAASDAARPARAAAAALAQRWGLALLTYEGSLVGIPVGESGTLNTTTAAVIQANRGAAYAAALLHDARVNWETLPGASGFNFFALASQYGEDAPVQQFQWGLVEDIYETSTQKMGAVRQLVADSAA